MGKKSRCTHKSTIEYYYNNGKFETYILKCRNCKKTIKSTQK